jgi:hypothetical protein
MIYFIEIFFVFNLNERDKQKINYLYKLTAFIYNCLL